MEWRWRSALMHLLMLYSRGMRGKGSAGTKAKADTPIGSQAKMGFSTGWGICATNIYTPTNVR
jgi:hypothetical protein